MWKRFIMDYYIHKIEQGSCYLYALDLESAHKIGITMLECYTNVRPFEILHIVEVENNLKKF